jgi:hypothetical protein
MVRGGRKYAFNPPKYVFRPNTKLPTYATHKSKITVRPHLSPRAPVSSLTLSPQTKSQGRARSDAEGMSTGRRRDPLRCSSIPPALDIGCVKFPLSHRTNGCWLWDRSSPRRPVAAANGGDGTEGPGERRVTVGSSAYRDRMRMLRGVVEAWGQGNQQHLVGGDDDLLNFISLGSIPPRRRKMTAGRRHGDRW